MRSVPTNRLISSQPPKRRVARAKGRKPSPEALAHMMRNNPEYLAHLSATAKHKSAYRPAPTEPDA